MEPEPEELRANYEGMSDGELLALAADMDSLTDVARGVLGSELRRRGLGEEQVGVAQRGLQEENLRSMSDEELVSLSADPDSLTGPDRNALDCELLRRGLKGDQTVEMKLDVEKFHEMSDGELLTLAADPDSVTDLAVNILHSELVRRGLEAEEQETAGPQREVSAEELRKLGDNDLLGLATDLESLTDRTRSALESELGRRGL